jgi:Mrp family chromosome partitioning ATPase
LRQELGDAFPDLQISFCQSPPFKPLSAEQDESVCREIERAEVGLLFVAFGCPKQERWMAEHAGRIGAVMLGVGAAFDFHAGLITRAPGWMQRSGLEWLHRVASEPGRLWQRYLFSNSVFIMRSATELAKAGVRRAKHGPVRLSQRVVVARQGASSAKSGLSGRSKNLDQQHMTELLARVDASMSRRSGRVIEFIASGEGEGTSTLAAAYAHTAAFRLNRRVLLLSAQSESPQRAGVLEAIANSRPMESAISRHAGGYWSGALFGAAADELGWALAERNELWKVMRGAFDEVVLDMPSSSASRIGVMMASHCDGVIVVLEAEKTRAPVVEALVASLQAVRANLLGTVLNKRQFHVPAALYRRL